MKVLVTDFDGTISKVDFYQAVINLNFASKKCMDSFWNAYVNHNITHFEAMKGIMGNICVGPDEIQPALDSMEFDSSFSSSFQKLTQAGWSLAIVSAGCEWYIQKHLQKVMVPYTSDLKQFSLGTVFIASNPGNFTEKQGLQMRLPTESPFFSTETGIDKPSATRYFCDNAEICAFAGDGRPDLDPALLVPSRHRFATGWLAEELHSLKKEFVRFNVWHEIIDHLLR